MENGQWGVFDIHQIIEEPCEGKTFKHGFEDQRDWWQSRWVESQKDSVHDELAGRGLFKGKKAKGERRAYLERQIEIWEALLDRLS